MPRSNRLQDSLEQRTFKTRSVGSPDSVFARSTTAGSPQSGHDSSVSFVGALTSWGTSVVTDRESSLLMSNASPIGLVAKPEDRAECGQLGTDIGVTSLSPKLAVSDQPRLGTIRRRPRGSRVDTGESSRLLILLALILVAIFVGLGFAIHVLWVVAAVLFVLWLIGLVIGRGESAGSRRFYRW